MPVDYWAAAQTRRGLAAAQTRRGSSLRIAFAFAALSAAAPAQVFYVRFTDPKTAKRFAANCIELRGEPVLVGELKAGITFDGKTVTKVADNGNNEFWVVNTSDPAAVPYDLVDGKPAAGKVKGGSVTLKGREIAEVQILLRRNSLYGLSREYAARKLAVADLLKARDVNKSGTPEWMFAHARYVSDLERLQAWLDTTVFPEAAKKLQPELDKQRKSVAKAAHEQRLAEALASIKIVPTPQKLVDAGKTLAPSAKFQVQESRHIRITCSDELPSEKVKELLELGEKIIDGFRVDWVDPYLGDDFKDSIPDSVFVEFWFGPEEANAHEHFLTDWYGLAWGDHKEQRLAALAGTYRRKQPPEYLEYWKLSKDSRDVDAIVAHDLGHVLSNLQWNDGRPDSANSLPDFLSEGLGFELSLSWLGRNSVTCKEFAQQQYANQKGGKEAERAILMGEVELFTRVALESGPPSDTLLRKPLHQMGDGDLCKSWSFLEYLLAKEGKPGQLFLRQLCDLIAKSGPSVAQIRELAEKSLGVSNQDVFKVMDDRWRAHAEALQKTGVEPKKR
jgi:hypothetical protein